MIIYVDEAKDLLNEWIGMWTYRAEQIYWLFFQ